MNMWQAIKAGAEKTVAADPKPLSTNSVRVASSHRSARKPVDPAQDAVAPQRISATMAAIAAAVEALPPFPLGAPLPILGTAKQYADQPCSNPKPRYMPKGTCHCGFLMGEHRTEARHG